MELESSKSQKLNARETIVPNCAAQELIPTENHFFSGGGEMGARMKAMDWSRTELGPVENWPQSLKTAVSICLNSKFSMVIWWGKSNVLLYNDAWIPVLGPLRHPQFLGRPGREAWPDIWNIIGPLLQSVLETGVATWITDHLLPIHNPQHGIIEERYFTYSYSPIRIEDGTVGGNFTAVSEMTQRVLHERELLLLRDMASHSAEATTTSDACKVVSKGISTNTTDIPFSCLYVIENHHLVLKEITGITRDSPVAPDKVPLDQLQDHPIKELIARVKTTALAESYDISPYDIPPCGHWNSKPTKCYALPILAPAQDVPIGVLLCGINQMRVLDDSYRSFLNLVTNQAATTLANAHAHEEERKKAQALAELDRAKTLFFNNISHEFRTPLTLMLGPLEDILFNSSHLTQRDREELTLIHRNSLRLLKLVNTLLDFSRIEAGRAQAKYQATDLTKLTTDLSSVFRAACEKAGLSLSVQCDQLRSEVYVDRDMWEKIVLNLLSNAYKFTLQGGIIVRLTDKEDHVQLKVIDSGTGIPSYELPRLFERFHRVQNSQGRTHEGTGIGLALVHELVKLHGGSIQVESTEGVGSTFTITIPYGNSHLSSIVTGELPDAPKNYARSSSWWLPNLEGLDTTTTEPQEHLQQQQHDTEQSQTDSTMEIPLSKNYRILLADDNADMREYVGRLLEPYYQVELVPDGLVALESALTHPPDLVLSDIMMPRLDGMGLLKALRENDSTKTLPIIFLSARAGEEARVEGLQSGADDYLIKPFTARELLARVKSHLEMSEVRTIAMKQAKRANDAKDHFLAVLSHELRTPLTPALLLSESLASDSEIPAKIREDMAIVARNIRLEVQLIDDLLDVTKITKGKLILHPQVISAAEIVEHTLQIVQYDADEKQINISQDWRAKDSYVLGDPPRLQQVFWNILKNALKFTPSGGKVIIKSNNLKMEDKEFVEISIEDTGIGIPPDALPKIFESFEQASRDVTNTFGGLGLGLSISRAIVNMHHGQLVAFSEGMSKGSKFTVTLPTVSSPKSNDISTLEKQMEVNINQYYDVLVIEDNKPTLLVIQRLLKKMGHRVVAAASVAEAIAAVREKKFELVISDIGLPDGSGLDLIKQIQQIYPVKAIALSGYGMEEDLAQSLKAGFDTHLIKPVQSDVLKSTIEQVMSSVT